MKTKDQKYNELIRRIKTLKPALDDPGVLTSNILSAVEKLSDKPKINMTFMVLRAVSWASSIAAVLLLGIFLEGQFTPIVPPTQKTNVSNYGSYSLTGGDIEEGGTLDKINGIVREKRKLKKSVNFFMRTLRINIETFKPSDYENDKNNINSIFRDFHDVLRYVLQNDNHFGS